MNGWDALERALQVATITAVALTAAYVLATPSPASRPPTITVEHKECVR